MMYEGELRGVRGRQRHASFCPISGGGGGAHFNSAKCATVATGPTLSPLPIQRPMAHDPGTGTGQRVRHAPPEAPKPHCP